MRIKNLMLAMFLVMCSGSLLFADLSKEEERQINSYTLTLPKIQQFSNATKNLLAVYKQDPKLFQSTETKQNSSLAEIISITESIPAAKKAIEAGGMSVKDYWTFQLAMAYAAAGHMAMKAGGKLPEGFSKENVQFYETHQAEFAKLENDLKAMRDITEDSADEDDLEDDAEDADEEDDDEEDDDE